MSDELEPLTSSDYWDGIGLEVLRNALVGICEEMLAALVRSGRSPSLRERRDASTSIYTPDAQMVVQAEHIPVHLGVMPYALAKILEAFPADTMRPGDCFVTNDPYLGMSNHLPDLIVGGPLFAGEVLVGFACSMAHHNDVGGIAPRSMSAEATEIFQEGIRIPPLQLGAGGSPREDVLRLIIANSRTPADLTNDVRAQAAVLRLAQRRLDELTSAHGPHRYREGIELLLERSERAARSRISAIPDGIWHGDSCAENGAEEFPIHVRLSVAGSDLTVDFAGTAEQSTGPYNATLANTYATVMTFLRGVLGSDLPASAGSYRPLRITAPEGTVVNPRFPAAVAATTQVSYHSYEALMRAWQNVAPDAVCADSGAGGVYSWGGYNPRTRMFYAYGEALGGGSGAVAGRDGQDAVMPPIANLRDTPAESLELDLPIRIDRYELITESGGSGRYRGGRGFRRVIRALAPSTWSIQISMSRRGPRGMFGGGGGRPTTCTVARHTGELEPVDHFTTLQLAAGDAIIIETAGGGGYGEGEAEGAIVAPSEEVNQTAAASRR